MTDPALRCPPSVPAAHDEDADFRILLDAGRCVPEPALEPAQTLAVVDGIAPGGGQAELDLADI